MRFTLLVLGTCIVSLAQPVAAQTCNEKCVQQFDPDRNPIGWACQTTGTNKNCVATTTQCSITMCGGSGGTKLYTSFSTPDGRVLAIQSQCDVTGSGGRSLDILMQTLSGTPEGDQLARGVRAARIDENRRTLTTVAASP